MDARIPMVRLVRYIPVNHPAQWTFAAAAESRRAMISELRGTGDTQNNPPTFPEG
jgi:hypothetical protein